MGSRGRGCRSLADQTLHPNRRPRFRWPRYGRARPGRTSPTRLHPSQQPTHRGYGGINGGGDGGTRSPSRAQAEEGVGRAPAAGGSGCTPACVDDPRHGGSAAGRGAAAAAAAGRLLASANNGGRRATSAGTPSGDGRTTDHPAAGRASGGQAAPRRRRWRRLARDPAVHHAQPARAHGDGVGG